MESAPQKRLAFENSREYVADASSHQVLAKVDELETEGQHVVRLSLVGYSMGGLVGRYLIAYVLSDYNLDICAYTV